MPMITTLYSILAGARKHGKAAAQFNVWNCEMLFGVLDAVERLQIPAILATGTAFLPMRELIPFAAMMRRAALDSAVALALHLDHAKSVCEVAAARDAGFTSAMIDGSALPLEGNIALTLAARQITGPAGMSLEGELGYVGAELGAGGEDLVATPACDAARFAAETGVDALAISIGNAHGLYKREPKLDFEALEAIAGKVDLPLVLHGGSGIPDDDIRKSIQMGVTKLNFHTELCLAASSAGSSGNYRHDTREARSRIAQKAMEKLLLVENEKTAR